MDIYSILRTTENPNNWISASAGFVTRHAGEGRHPRLFSQRHNRAWSRRRKKVVDAGLRRHDVRFRRPQAPICLFGIHDFSVSVTNALDSVAAKKSWMPAFAGMTGFFGGRSQRFASLSSQLIDPSSQLLGVEMQNSPGDAALRAGQQ